MAGALVSLFIFDSFLSVKYLGIIRRKLIVISIFCGSKEILSTYQYNMLFSIYIIVYTQYISIC